ncbi:hypothetical protein [Dyadobacter luticola]|uniref:Uncharacterized protein n=1 Tax=Dyadobacter luticola TaxID=1979387 RepID=A0A5R9KPX2_9BACT|nr:hypothetical protein [Dyadobacter luticola]TLU98217.1 hypothetical protein FEN17_25940 [Dyadobacter luticola]
MQTFGSVEDAFKWFLTNIYPSLSPDRKKGRLKTAWRDYTYGLGISEKRMRDILSEFGKVDVKILVTFTPD